MKKDIPHKKVEEIVLGASPDFPGDPETAWKVYLINLKADAIKGVIINSTGYGERDDQPVKTSRIRQFFEEIAPRSFVEVELIPTELTCLSNEFWISFWHNDHLFDKKYVFVSGALAEENCSLLPIVDLPGVILQ